MKTLEGESSTVEQQFWTKLKVFFFCEADEKLHWTDCAWLLFIGLAIVMAVVVTIV